jgi:hypothetical protein
MIRVAVLTPSYDGKVSVEYANSLFKSSLLLQSEGYSMDHIYCNNESIVQSARNKLIKVAHDNNYDSVVWIDSDIIWNPEDLLKLFSSDKDVIGATYRRKSLNESYVLKTSEELGAEDICRVSGLGFGFIKMSRNIIKNLWNMSESYIDDGIVCKNIFEIIVGGGQMYSEDISVCKKINDLGINVYLDKTINLVHQGSFNYVGNFNGKSI